MRNLFRAIDIFKTPIKITYKRNPSYATLFGAFISIIVLILIILLAVFFSRNIYKRINPYIVYQEETLMHYPYIPITEHNFTMGIKIIDETMQPWSKEKIEGYLEIKPMYLSFINGTFEIINLPYKPCEEVYSNIANITINSDNFIGAMCPYNFSFPIFGNPDTGDFGALTNLVYTCMNSTKNPEKVCKSTQEIQDSMRNTQFKILYFDNILYANDYNQPLHKITSAYWDFLDYGVFKNIEFYFKSVTIDTDDGVIFENMNTQYGSLFDSKLNQKSLLRSVNPELPLFQIDIKVINQRVYCKRIYEKIQNVLANMGGMIKVLMTVGFIIIYLINRTVIQFDMVNDFYDYSEIYQSDIKKVKEIREMAKAGVRYSIIKNNKKNNKKGNNKNDKNSGSKNFKCNGTTQPQSGALGEKNQIEMEKVNEKNNKSELEGINSATYKENNPNSSNIQVEKEDNENKSYVVEGGDNSHSVDVIGESVNMRKSSLNQISDISMIHQPSNIDINMGVSQINSNRILNPPENDQKLSEDPTHLSKDDHPQQILSLSEEYLLRKKKHSVLTQLTYTPLEVINLTFPFKKFSEKLQKKSEILKKSYEKIMEVLDISSFMLMAHDINLIKGLFLNEDQIRVSKYIKRIMFTENMLKPDLESELLNIKKYYKRCTESYQDAVDKKLIENMDDDLLFVLKNC
jgi:hypothetical protein